MKVTAIKQQVKQTGRYSIFVDDKYAFSLSENGLLEHKLALGQEIDQSRLKKLKTISSDDKLYVKTLNYVSRYVKSEWEVEQYLKRNHASPTLIGIILNKLRNIDLINDERFTQNFINTRESLRPTSRRKMQAELLKRHIDRQVIGKYLSHNRENEQSALARLIASKRRQSKYKDDQKLMQYLARSGFNYDDIKSALKSEEEY